jgi:endonuclease/exonuclease/phosphatase family metal-dependent hydrolase
LASPDKWLCLGDFNEISNLSEKVGGAIRNEAQMEAFRETLDKCQLRNLGYKGSKFTWRNKQETGTFIKEWLDRATATSDWCRKFPHALVEVLPNRTSDHNPLWV